MARWSIAWVTPWASTGSEAVISGGSCDMSWPAVLGRGIRQEGLDALTVGAIHLAVNGSR